MRARGGQLHSQKILLPEYGSVDQDSGAETVEPMAARQGAATRVAAVETWAMAAVGGGTVERSTGWQAEQWSREVVGTVEAAAAEEEVVGEEQRRRVTDSLAVESAMRSAGVGKKGGNAAGEEGSLGSSVGSMEGAPAAAAAVVEEATREKMTVAVDGVVAIDEGVVVWAMAMVAASARVGKAGGNAGEEAGSLGSSVGSMENASAAAAKVVEEATREEAERVAAAVEGVTVAAEGVVMWAMAVVDTVAEGKAVAAVVTARTVADLAQSLHWFRTAEPASA